MEVVDTGAALRVPLGEATLGRIFNVLGGPVGELVPVVVMHPTTASCTIAMSSSKAGSSHPPASSTYNDLQPQPSLPSMPTRSSMRRLTYASQKNNLSSKDVRQAVFLKTSPEPMTSKKNAV